MLKAQCGVLLTLLKTGTEVDLVGLLLAVAEYYGVLSKAISCTGSAVSYSVRSTQYEV